MASEPIYTLPIPEAYTALETSPNGLDNHEVESRRSLYGSNQLSEPPPEPVWRKLISFTAHPMALLLWAAGGIALSRGEATLGVIIWIVVLVNAAFSYWREYRAEQATAALQHLL